MKRGVKYLQVTFDDGVYEIPAYIIAQKRADYYTGDKPFYIHEYEYHRGLEDDQVLLDFLSHLDWSDVKNCFLKVEDYLEDRHTNQWQDEIAEHRIKVIGD